MIVEEEITLEEALIGGKFTIDHLAGKKVTLSLKANHIVKPNDIFVIEGLGMPKFKSPEVFGKLYVMVSIKFPKQMESDKLTSLLKVIS